MTLQTSGAISFSDLNVEARKSSTAQISLNDDVIRTISDNPKYSSVFSPSLNGMNSYYGKTYGASTIHATAFTNPFQNSYVFNQGFGTRYSNPSTLPTTSTTAVHTNRHKSVVGFIHGSSTNSYTAYYPWSDSTGYGSRYSAAGLFAVSVGNFVGGDVLRWTRDGSVIFTGGQASSPYNYAHNWTINGWASAFPAPSSSFVEANGLSLFRGRLGRQNVAGTGTDEIVFIAATSSANRATSYPFNTVNGWGTKYTNPSQPNNSSLCVDSDDATVIYGSGDSATDKYTVAYAFTPSGGFGTKYSSMTNTDITSNPYSVNFTWVRSPYTSNGFFTKFICYAHINSPYITCFNWTTAGGWGSKLSNPATLPAGPGRSLNTNLNIDVAVGHNTAPHITVYPLTTSGYGTKYADPATAATSNTDAIWTGTSFSTNMDTNSL